MKIKITKQDGEKVHINEENLVGIAFTNRENRTTYSSIIPCACNEIALEAALVTLIDELSQQCPGVLQRAISRYMIKT